jgi:low temperature requirement protein LtrA
LSVSFVAVMDEAIVTADCVREGRRDFSLASRLPPAGTFIRRLAGRGGVPVSEAGSGADKRVTWVELFFDLVFVFAVTQVSSLLHEEHSWAGVGRAVIVFVPMYWAWVGTSMHGNLHDVDRPRDRIGVFAVGLCGLLMTVAVPAAYGSRGLLFGASYWAARAVLFPLVQRTYRGIGFNSYTAGATISGPLMLLGGLVHGPARVTAWSIAAAVDLFVPYLARRRLARVPFEPSHLSERYAGFVIIALGESVVDTGITAADLPLTTPRIFAVAVAFALACALWWVYFALAATAIRSALQSAPVAIEAIRPVLPYGHLGFIVGIIAVAAGIGQVIAHPLAHLHVNAAALLCGGAGLYLATFGYTRWHLFHTVAAPRLVAAAACVALLPLAPRAAALVIPAGLLAVTVALNAVEARIVRLAGPAATDPAHSSGTA